MSETETDYSSDPIEQLEPCPLCGEDTEHFPRIFDDRTVVGECNNENCSVVQFDATRSIDMDNDRIWECDPDE